MNQEILPVLDHEALQKAATEYAMKGAIESIKEYYSGWNSPFRKAIDADLESKGVSGSLKLPDIIGLINESLSKEIDAIANAAVAETFIPLVKKKIVRAEAAVNFSDLLKEFIEATGADDYDDCEVSVEENIRHNWLSVKISNKENVYELTLHEDWDTRNSKDKKYQVLSLPRHSEGYYSNSRYKSSMKLSIEGATLEMPFTRDILSDTFCTYIAGLVLAKSKITMDTEYFDEDWFSTGCHCD